MTAPANVAPPVAPLSRPALPLTLAIAVVNVIFSGFGATALAGYGIAARLDFLLIPLVFGIDAAMTAIVGTNVGAGNIARTEQVGWTDGAVRLGAGRWV